MKLALVFCLALCLSMVMTAPLTPVVVALPAVGAGVPALAFAGANTPSGAAAITGLAKLGAAGLLASNRNRG